MYIYIDIDIDIAILNILYFLQYVYRNTYIILTYRYTYVILNIIDILNYT